MVVPPTFIILAVIVFGANISIKSTFLSKEILCCVYNALFINTSCIKDKPFLYIPIYLKES